MGLQDVFFKLRLPFDSRRGPGRCPRRISEEIYFHALCASTELAEQSRPPRRASPRPAPPRASSSSTCGASPRRTRPAGTPLRERIAAHGLRNSLLIAIAPTATIASIAGCYECIEPQVSNLFKRETLSGEFLQINAYLVRDLQAPGPVDRAGHRAPIKRAEGSVQDIERDPRRREGDLPHGVGDPDAGADRHGAPTAAPSSTSRSR